MEDFVTFEIAKKLKEKGFPQRPDYFNYSSYFCWDGLRKIHPLYNASVWFDPNINRENIYFAPTVSQVLKWLREEKKIHIDIEYRGVFKWRYILIYLHETYFDYFNVIEKGFYSYEEAALAGINYVLDNLI